MINPSTLFIISIALIVVLAIANTVLSFRRVRSGVNPDEVSDNGQIRLSDVANQTLASAKLFNGALVLKGRDGIATANITLVMFNDGKRQFKNYLVSFPSAEEAVIMLPRNCRSVHIAICSVNGQKVDDTRVLTNPLIINVVLTVGIAAVAIAMSILFAYSYSYFVYEQTDYSAPYIYAFLALLSLLGAVVSIVLNVVNSKRGK